MQSNEEIVKRWSVSAPFWEKYHAVIRQMFAPITQALVEDAEIGPRHTVLDVATGSGEPALSLSPLVGSEGAVFGVDPIPDMIAGARRSADRLKLKNIKFDIAFADHLPFPDRTFDAVVSRFGIMFFPSPVDGVREILRVLKPEAKFAIAVWSCSENNPFHFTLSRIMDRFVPVAPPAAGAPDMFLFAQSGKLVEILKNAGTSTPVERIFHFNIEASLSPEAFWALRCEMSETLRERLTSLSASQRAEVGRLAIESIRNYSTPSGISFPAEVLIASGTKSQRHSVTI
jgi:ubiquinone/menaquinone biosynthesis C-methylase UbiE